MKVGIFWKIENEFLVDSVPIAMGEPYGKAIQYGGHYDFWGSFTPGTLEERKFKWHDYDYYPRGRVVFFPKAKRFHLYADKCLGPDDLKQVSELFGLQDKIVKIYEDAHYRCRRCNRQHLE